MVPGAGLEPAREKFPQDFKSCVSTNSTIQAGIRKALAGFEPAIKLLQSHALATWLQRQINRFVYLF